MDKKEEEKSLFVQLMGKSPMVLVLDVLLDTNKVPLTKDKLFLSCKDITLSDFDECIKRLDSFHMILKRDDMLGLDNSNPINNMLTKFEVELIAHELSEAEKKK